MDYTAIVSVLAALSGIALGWVGRSRTVKMDTKEEASSDAFVRADIKYIKRGVEDIRLEQRAQSKRFVELAERVTRLEESQKSLHKRVDRFDAIEGRG